MECRKALLDWVRTQIQIITHNRSTDLSTDSNSKTFTKPDSNPRLHTLHAVSTHSHLHLHFLSCLQFRRLASAWSVLALICLVWLRAPGHGSLRSLGVCFHQPWSSTFLGRHALTDLPSQEVWPFSSQHTHNQSDIGMHHRGQWHLSYHSVQRIM